MPSRPAVAAILLFWLGTVGYLGYSRVWPWLTAAGAPAVTVSATDETGRIKVRWTVLYKSGRGGFEKAGFLTSELKADDANSYTFVSQYKDLKFDIATLPVRIPTATTELTVDRAGHLRRQTVTGTVAFKALGTDVTGTAEVTSQVVDGELRGRVRGSVFDLKLDPTDLPPVPVRDGQVLNPLLPLNRLSGVWPGKPRWTIRQSDPLGESLAQLAQAWAKQNGLGAFLPARPDAAEELLAEVLPESEGIAVRRGEETVPCWVIVYRGKDNKIAARTWVSAADGKVMRQEAAKGDNTLRLDRDE